MTKTNEFIQQMKRLYGSEFNYSETKVTDTARKVIIQHSKCGQFFPVRPEIALSKDFTKCPRCNKTKPRVPTKTKGLENLISYTDELRAKPEVESAKQQSFGEMSSLNYKRHDNFFTNLEEFKETQ